MKNHKRLVALLLASVMVLSLAACEKKGGETANDTPKPSTEQDTPTPTPTPEPEKYDFGGVTVKAFGSEWNNLDSEEAKYVEAKAYVEQKYNIKLEKAAMEGYDGYNDDDILISSIAAGDPAAHIINLNPESMVSCYVNGLLYDLTDSLDKLQVGSTYTDVATWKGRCYGVAYENIGDTWVLVYDRSYLKEIGMEKTPTDMFMEGKWDYESCKAYLAEMKSKLPDGKYPIGCYPFHWGVMAASANGTQLVDVNGNLNFTDESVVEATQFYQELEEAGLAFPSFIKRDEEGKVAEYDMAYAADDERIVLKRVETWQLGGLGFDYGIVYWPWGSNVKCTGDYTTLSDNYATAGVYWGMDAIVAAAVDATGIPGDVLALIDQDYRYAVADDGFEWMHEAWVAEKAGNYKNEGPEAGEPRSFTTEQDIELFDWGHTRYKADYAWSFDSAGFVNIWRVFQDIFMEYKDVRSTLESAKNEALANLKEAGIQ
ncbi:MAG: hypothetical protein K6B75_08065 [Lachnospiraceae bacterium]|nr:hypothetical protein [Lachnospiraceae bacterium]